MIFEHTAELVISGTKTQTRRLVKAIPTHIAIGDRYSGEVLLESSIQWGEDRSFPGYGVYRTSGVQGGWLSGDVCVEPDWTHTAKWIVGNCYSVQPKRGAPALLWRWSDLADKPVGKEIWYGKHEQELWAWGWRRAEIQILNIWKEDVRYISDRDVKAEGFENRMKFLELWTRMHDPDMFFYQPYQTDKSGNYLRGESGEPLTESHWNYTVRGKPIGGKRSKILGEGTHLSAADVELVMRRRPAARYLAWGIEFVLVTEDRNHDG